MRYEKLLLVVLLLLVAAACGKGSVGGDGPALAAQGLEITKVTAALPVDDPDSRAWRNAREVVVTLLIQDVAEPRLTEKGVETLRLKALHDGAKVAFRLDWADATAEHLVEIDQSTDAAALEFPATGPDGPVPDSMMGEEGKPVSLILWRNAWQRRLEGEAYGIEALYPNRSVDHYPPEAGPTEDARATLENLYDPPAAVGNPMAQGVRTSATEDLTAEGFGTLTHASQQTSSGKGVHKGGRWSVVITRPLDITPASAGILRPGKATYVSVAVWNGANNQSGSLKMRSIWIPVRFAEARP
jgi:hypothetical protein